MISLHVLELVGHSPSAVILLKVSGPQPDGLLAGKDGQRVGVYGPSTLNGSVARTLETKKYNKAILYHLCVILR